VQYVINPKGILQAFQHPEQQLLMKTNARAILASFLTDTYADDAALLAAIKAVTQLDYRLMSAGPNQQEVWHGISTQRVSELGALQESVLFCKSCQDRSVRTRVTLGQYCRPGYRDGAIHTTGGSEAWHWHNGDRCI
jgi:hypothetical protein